MYVLNSTFIIIIMFSSGQKKQMINLVVTLKDGILSQSELSQVWKAPSYPTHIHPFLLALLTRFEICFTIHSPISIRNEVHVDDNICIT